MKENQDQVEDRGREGGENSALGARLEGDCGGEKDGGIKHYYEDVGRMGK